MGGKTSIQINVYRQTSPLPCSVSMSDGCGSPVRGWPQRDAGTQVVPAPAGLFVAGIAVCPAGATQAGVPQCLREFCSLGERNKADGEHGICCSSVLPQTAQQGRERGAGWREASPSASWFSFGDFHTLRLLGSHGNPASFPEIMLGSCISPLHLGQTFGQERACPVSRT